MIGASMLDPVIQQGFHYQGHTDVLTAVTKQRTEAIILDRNAELRKNKGAINDLGKGSAGGTWGRQLATIPEIMFYRAIRLGYDLMSKDPQHAASEMQRFLATNEGRTCLVQGS
jgi:hypothetical protein